MFPSLMQQLDPPQKEQLLTALTEMDFHMRKLADIPWLWPLMEPSDEEVMLDEENSTAGRRAFHYVLLLYVAQSSRKARSFL